MKIKLIIISLCLMFASVTYSQQLTPRTISSAGISSSNGAVILEYSLGGLTVKDINTATFMYTPDFLQPDAGVTAIPPFINNVTLGGNTFLDNAGTTFVSNNTMLEFTLGEVQSISLSNANQMLTQGILQPETVTQPLPVTGLEFYAVRLNANEVKLTWKTVQELYNKGFHIERQFDKEPDFHDIGFRESQAKDGNSQTPLTYIQNDMNSHAGVTYYRLKQEDADGRFVYSVVRSVEGNNGNAITLQVWPVPAVSHFNFTVKGISKMELVNIYDDNGRILRQFNAVNETPYQVAGLLPGVYFVCLASDRSIGQKVVIR